MSAASGAPALYEKLGAINCILSVLSYGFKTAISGVLERAGLMKHITGVLTPGHFDNFEDGEDMGDQKRLMLTHLRDTYSSEGEDADIILVDDTEPNVTTALSMGLKGVHVKGAAGMDDNDLDRLHQALESLDVSKKCILALDFDLTMCKTHLTSVFCYPYLQETGGRLDQAGLMQRIPDDMLVPCVAPLVSAFAPPASQ